MGDAGHDHRTPFEHRDERGTLLGFLDYLRASVVRKTGDLPDDVAQSPGVPSGTSLLGLVKHLTMVEVKWFQFAFAGWNVEVPAGLLEPGEAVADVVAAYERASARSNEIVAACPDLSRRCRRPGVAPEPMTLRWVLVHMVEETARHAGHADILRERLDGSTGR